MAKMNRSELTAKITMPGFTAEASLVKKGEPYRRFRIYHQGTTHEEVVPQCTWVRWCDDDGDCYRTCVSILV
jgi:hypothetical protein